VYDYRAKKNMQHAMIRKKLLSVSLENKYTFVNTNEDGDDSGKDDGDT
jgi:hypothetical protein